MKDAYLEAQEKLSDEIWPIINEKKFTVKDAYITYRNLNYWSKAGLLNEDRNTSSGWRRMSLKDLLWLRILRDLRELGVPVDKLKTTHTSLFFDEHGDPMHELELAIYKCIHNVPVFLVIHANGEADTLTVSDMRAYDEVQCYPSQIRLNLYRLWCEIVGTPEATYHAAFNKGAKKAEREILQVLHAGDDCDIHLKIRNDTVYIDQSKRVAGAEKVVELVKSLNFGEIITKVENGKVVSNHVTKKEKIKK